jgi:hypothetical protein
MPMPLLNAAACKRLTFCTVKTVAKRNLKSNPLHSALRSVATRLGQPAASLFVSVAGF